MAPGGTAVWCLTGATAAGAGTGAARFEIAIAPTKRPVPIASATTSATRPSGKRGDARLCGTVTGSEDIEDPPADRPRASPDRPSAGSSRLGGARLVEGDSQRWLGAPSGDRPTLSGDAASFLPGRSAYLLMRPA